MNKELLDQEIQLCIDGAGIEIYFLLRNDNLFKANIRPEEQGQLRELFTEELTHAVISNDELQIINISTADERRNAIYLYDLDIPEDLSVVDDVFRQEDIPFFSFADNALSEVKAIIVMIGNVGHQLVIYKQNSPVSVLKKDSSFSLWGNEENQLVRLDKDILKINSKFDFFKIGDNLFILNLKTLERFFGFHNVIKTEAEKGIDAIARYDLVENIDSLKEQLDEIGFARKLTKIGETSPVLGHVPNNRIIEFVNHHPALKNRVKTNPDGTKLSLDTKKSKQLFIKLLNDDYLTSDLTSLYYDSLAKDNIEE